MLTKMVQAGAPLNPTDVPSGMKATPHPVAGVMIDKADWAKYDPAPLMPEAETLAELYRLFLCGNSIGHVGAMGGLVPEKLQWSTIRAACGQLGVKLNRWAVELVFAVDAIRLDAEFKRIDEQAKRKP